jgi:predicted secreted protein
LSGGRPARALLAHLALGAAALGVLSALAASASAEDDAKHRVSFAVERSRDVSNDWVTAVIGVSDEDSDAARLADRVNQTMRWALDTAKAAKGVAVKSGGYQTQPVYEKGKIARWSASQDLVLEGSDVDALSELVGTLQQKLLLRSIGFSVSPAQQREIEDSLIDEALQAFQARAKRVAAGLSTRDYELVSLSIQTPNGGGPVPMFRARPMAMEAAPAPPSFESGQSTLIVRIDATIELER